jgi:hypothetical protein
MSRLRIAGRRRRVVLALGAVAASAMVLTSCVSTSGPYGGDHYTMSINKSGTANILWGMYGPSCDQDVDHDGNKGSPHDRALCGFFITRAGECNHADGIGQGICNVATEANGKDSAGPLWFDFYTATQRVLNNNWACLQVTYGAFGDVRRWTAAPLGFEGCVK